MVSGNTPGNKNLSPYTYLSPSLISLWYTAHITILKYAWQRLIIPQVLVQLWSVWIVADTTHIWGRDKMAAVSQTIFSNAFSWMKMYEFRLKFHWSSFLRFQLTIFQHWFRYWLGAVQATSHYLNQWWLVYWRIYASLGLNELNQNQNLETADNSFIILSVHKKCWSDNELAKQ